MDEFLFTVAREFGPLASVVAFFIYRDWKREADLTKRIVALEEEQSTILLSLVEKTTAVIERNTVVMEQLKTALPWSSSMKQPTV
jgi:hypothetical protein